MSDAEIERPPWRSGDARARALFATLGNAVFDQEAAAETITSVARATVEMLDEAQGAPTTTLLSLMASLVRYAAETTDDLREGRVRRRLPLVAVDCEEGCSHCCHLHVSLSVPEAIVLSEYLSSTLDPDALAELRARLAVAAREAQTEDTASRLRNRRACPLLVSDRCSAYRVRPLACFGASSADRRRCAAAFDDADPDAQIPVEPLRAGVARSVQFGLAAGLYARGLDPRRYELATLLSTIMGTAEPSRPFLEGVLFSACATPADPPGASVEQTCASLVARDPALRTA